MYVCATVLLHCICKILPKRLKYAAKVKLLAADPLGPLPKTNLAKTAERCKKAFSSDMLGM